VYSPLLPFSPFRLDCQRLKILKEEGKKIFYKRKNAQQNFTFDTDESRLNEREVAVKTEL